ncbi:hypothetical protein KKA00_03560 [bacterium]|nr:hypothetical protein [bacterium]MBU1651270.1 hypothetical protein [bacterium]MBU1881436.1 hypothetical protein [bacterium]
MSLDDLEKKFTEFADDMEKRFNDFTQKLENEFFSKKTETEKLQQIHKPPPKGRDAAFWGIVLVVVGVILLGNHFRWFYLDVPLIPAALVILGAYLIMENRQR